ncbi:MAG TPA: hypothetical protein VGT99_00930 [Gammaproteobacteria bacterium]|nr:hypothetical protein [Gammaproteobacteria bacterium]
MRVTVHGQAIMRCIAASATVLLPLMLTGCGGTPVRGVLEPPAHSQPAPSAATAEATTPAVVEATVTVVPTARGAYRVISVTVPKGVSSLAVIIPDAVASAAPPAAPAAAQGGDRDCSGGIFSCSKLISETVTAIVAAIVALLGLIAMLRRSRSRKKK